jgi:hypothetical protein
MGIILLCVVTAKMLDSRMVELGCVVRAVINRNPGHSDIPPGAIVPRRVHRPLLVVGSRFPRSPSAAGIGSNGGWRGYPGKLPDHP